VTGKRSSLRIIYEQKSFIEQDEKCTMETIIILVILGAKTISITTVSITTVRIKLSLTILNTVSYILNVVFKPIVLSVVVRNAFMLCYCAGLCYAKCAVSSAIVLSLVVLTTIVLVSLCLVSLC
jgi:hypothetical protein